MERAALYIRVSTDEQAKHGVSLAAQEERLRAYCALRNLDIVAVVKDEGVSAYKHLDKRPGGAELLAMIARREVRHIVVAKLDRAFRNAADCLSRTEAWDKAGVSLHLVDMGGNSVDTSSPAGRMWLTMLAGFAEFERAMIAERTEQALAHKRDNGEVYGPLMFGLDRDGDRVTENRDELDTLATIRQMHADGTSVRRIAVWLNENGVPAKRGGTWSHTTVHRALRNRIDTTEVTAA